MSFIYILNRHQILYTLITTLQLIITKHSISNSFCAHSNIHTIYNSTVKYLKIEFWKYETILSIYGKNDFSLCWKHCQIVVHEHPLITYHSNLKLSFRYLPSLFNDYQGITNDVLGHLLVSLCYRQNNSNYQIILMFSSTEMIPDVSCE